VDFSFRSRDVTFLPFQFGDCGLPQIEDVRPMTVQKLTPIHPGEVLFEEFMRPMGISQKQLGRDLGVSPRRINEIIHGKRGISADSALRLSAYFGVSAKFWMS